MNRQTFRKQFFVILQWATIILTALITLFPLYMALINSLKTNAKMQNNILALPDALYLDNYISAITKMDFFRSFTNSLIVTVLGVGGMVIFAAMAGWRLRRTRSILSHIIYGMFIFSMLIPFHTIMIPLYKVANVMNIHSTLYGLSMIYIGLGISMAIFLFHGFVGSIPIELEESARIDGCGIVPTFMFIVLPMLKPIMITVIVMNTVWIWNDFLLPLIILQKSTKYTMVLSTNMLFGQYTNDWTAILSSLVITAIPVIVFYIIFQKHIIQGISDGAVKE